MSSMEKKEHPAGGAEETDTAGRVTGKKDHSVGPAEEADVAGSVSIWLSQSVAPGWLADARAEVEVGKELAATLEEGEWSGPLTRSLHREIVLAVCFSEAFLLEYLRDFIFIHAPGKKDWTGLVSFVKSRRDGDGKLIWKQGIQVRWKETVKALQGEGKLKQGPVFESQTWEIFRSEVLRYRNNIVHSTISLPVSPGKQEEPSPRTLAERGPGWATGVVVDLAWELHELNSNDLDPPTYIRAE